MHDAASEYDPLRGKRQYYIHQSLCYIVGLKLPYFLFVGKFLCGPAPALPDCRTACHTLQTVLMERTSAGVMIVTAGYHKHMSEFGMEHAVYQIASRQNSSADSGSYGEIYCIGKSFGASPGDLSEQGTVYVSVKSHRDVIRLFQFSQYIVVIPTRLGG